MIFNLYIILIFYIKYILFSNSIFFKIIKNEIKLKKKDLNRKRRFPINIFTFT